MPKTELMMSSQSPVLFTSLLSGNGTTFHIVTQACHSWYCLLHPYTHPPPGYVDFTLHTWLRLLLILLVCQHLLSPTCHAPSPDRFHNKLDSLTHTHPCRPTANIGSPLQTPKLTSPLHLKLFNDFLLLLWYVQNSSAWPLISNEAPLIPAYLPCLLQPQSHCAHGSIGQELGLPVWIIKLLPTPEIPGIIASSRHPSPISLLG